MRYIWSFLWHALYRNIKVPRDVKTMVVCGTSEEVSDHVLEGAVLHIFQKLRELKRQRNNFYQWIINLKIFTLELSPEMCPITKAKSRIWEN